MVMSMMIIAALFTSFSLLDYVSAPFSRVRNFHELIGNCIATIEMFDFLWHFALHIRIGAEEIARKITHYSMVSTTRTFFFFFFGFALVESIGIVDVSKQ